MMPYGTMRPKNPLPFMEAFMMKRDACTVDGCHPNDLGFYRIAQGMLPTLKHILTK